MNATIEQAWSAGPTIESGLDERDAIRRAIEDYCGGWFQADAGRMGRALHPGLAKFSVDADAGRSAGLEIVGYEAMVDAAGRGYGIGREGSGRTDVSILGVSGTIACAELRADAYVEFLLLVRDGGAWRIAASAWRWADGAGPRAPG